MHKILHLSAPLLLLLFMTWYAKAVFYGVLGKAQIKANVIYSWYLQQEEEFKR